MLNCFVEPGHVMSDDDASVLEEIPGNIKKDARYLSQFDNVKQGPCVELSYSDIGLRKICSDIV